MQKSMKIYEVGTKLV